MNWWFQPLAAAPLLLPGGGGGGAGTGSFNVLAQGFSLAGDDDFVTSSITVTAGRPVVVSWIDSGDTATSGTPHTLSGAGQTWVKIYEGPVSGDDSAYTRMTVWTSDAASGGSGALTFGTEPITANAYQIIEFEPDAGGTATLGTAIAGTTATAATSNSVALTGTPEYWLLIVGASRATGYGDLTATPRAGWTELSEQIADEGTWLIGLEAQASPLDGDTDASVTWNRSINIPMVAIPVTVTGGGGSDATVTPIVGSVTVDGLAPTPSAGSVLTPDVGSVTATGLAPTLAAAATATTATGSVTVDGLAPDLSYGADAAPAVGSVTVDGLAPDVIAGGGVSVTTDLGSVTVDGLAPSIELSATIDTLVGSITVSGLAPDAGAGASSDTGTGSVVISGLEPTVDTGGGGGPVDGKQLRVVAPVHPGQMM